MATPWLPSFNNRKQDPQTIHLPFVAYTRVNGVALSGAATTLNITTALTLALSTAARNAQPVPVQVSTTEEIRGIVTGADFVQVYDSAGQKIAVNGNEVFATIAEAAGVYTVTFRAANSSGTVVDATVPAQDLSFELPYRFDLHELPSNALIAITARNVNEDITTIIGATTNTRTIQEELTATATNTIPAVTGPVDADGAKWIEYRGFNMTANKPSSVFTIDAGTNAITFNNTTAGFTIPAGEVVTVYYSQS